MKHERRRCFVCGRSPPRSTGADWVEIPGPDGAPVAVCVKHAGVKEVVAK